MVEKIRYLLEPLSKGEALQFSSIPFRSMQRPWSRTTMSFAVAAMLRRAGASWREVEDEKERGENGKRAA